MARPTLGLQIHVDTQNRVYVVSPGGFSGPIERVTINCRTLGNLLADIFREIGRERGLSAYADEALIYMEEQFNVIRGSRLVGKLFDLGIQIAPRICSRV